MTELVRAIREGDDVIVEEAVLRLSRSRRWHAPLALAVEAFSMLFDGLRLVFSNWRLTVVQVLPAMWNWLAMLDFKAHVLHGKSFHALTGPVVIPIVLAVTAITARVLPERGVRVRDRPRGSARHPGRYADARGHLPVVLGSGAVIGLFLGLSTIVVTRWGSPWFGLSLSVVVGVMMVCYVAVPSSLIGIKSTRSRRDRLTAGP